MAEGAQGRGVQVGTAPLARFRAWLLAVVVCLELVRSHYYTGYYAKDQSCTDCTTQVTAFSYGTCAYTDYAMIKCWGFTTNPILAFEMAPEMDSNFIGSKQAHLGNALLPVWIGKRAPPEQKKRDGILSFALSGAANVKHMW